MAEKAARKPGGAAGIAIIDETSDDLSHATNGNGPGPELPANKPACEAKAKGDASAVCERLGPQQLPDPADHAAPQHHVFFIPRIWEGG